jgi:hypothetical protein
MPATVLVAVGPAPSPRFPGIKSAHSGFRRSRRQIITVNICCMQNQWSKLAYLAGDCPTVSDRIASFSAGRLRAARPRCPSPNRLLRLWLRSQPCLASQSLDLRYVTVPPDGNGKLNHSPATGISLMNISATYFYGLARAAIRHARSHASPVATVYSSEAGPRSNSPLRTPLPDLSPQLGRLRKPVFS